MNESLEKGSMLAQLEYARQKGLPVIVFNPNYNRDPVNNEVIPYSHSMQAHSVFVWEKYVQPAKFNKVFIIAHSAGGACLAAI
mmetsp:Transcript_25158/g.24620  ORF Transcript_25158/g.24620 Transcript_25158/m.24620 type:complete len:83 (-) Transcript_25158:295-543(-)